MSGQEAGETEVSHGSKEANRTRLFGIIPLAAAVLFWVAAAAVVLSPLSAGQKVWASSGFLVWGGMVFWVAALVLGREVLGRYGRFPEPRGWFGNGRR